MDATKFKTVDEYLALQPEANQLPLEALRSIIKKAAPRAEEVISYNMPGYDLNGILVWFAGYKKHIGFYPKPSAIEAFRSELTKYELSKGTVQFPLDKPLPSQLITKMVKYRIQENLANAQSRMAKSRKKK